MIKLNGTQLTTQPSDVKEETIPIQTDTVAIDGSVQRNRLNTKYQSTLSFPNMSATDYQQVYNIIAASGVVTYYNNLSDYSDGVLQFTGLATFKEESYVPGSSGYRPLTVTIRQS